MNPMYAVAINTGEAADKLAQEAAANSQALNQGALAGSDGSAGNVNTPNPSFGVGISF